MAIVGQFESLEHAIGRLDRSLLVDRETATVTGEGRSGAFDDAESAAFVPAIRLVKNLIDDWKLDIPSTNLAAR